MYRLKLRLFILVEKQKFYNIYKEKNILYIDKDIHI